MYISNISDQNSSPQKCVKNHQKYFQNYRGITALKYLDII